MAKTVLAGILAVTVIGCTKSAEPASVMSVDAIALDGYDPVAYFVSAQAHRADGSYSYSYENLNWYFQSSENLERFKADPRAYIPEFGGFCALELADEDLVTADPQQWHIHNGRLYLFNDEDAKKEWFSQMVMVLPAAYKAWDAIRNPVEETEEED